MPPMLLGVALPVAGAWATPENLVTVARRAEELGYHSVWVFQPAAQPAGRRALQGSADQIREDLARYAAAGVTELFLEPNFTPGGGVLDRALAAMETFRPAASGSTSRA